MSDHPTAAESSPAPSPPPMLPPVLVVMGVSGSGKSTIGALLAARLGCPFADGDSFHPPANVAKMAAGIPLTDEDRAPWLASLRALIEQTLATGGRLVLACSALRAAYRARLNVDPARVRFIHLAGSAETIAARQAGRVGHFMPPALLASQWATLEPPADALAVDVTPPPETIVEIIIAALGQPR